MINYLDKLPPKAKTPKKYSPEKIKELKKLLEDVGEILKKELGYDKFSNKGAHFST